MVYIFLHLTIDTKLKKNKYNVVAWENRTLGKMLEGINNNELNTQNGTRGIGSVVTNPISNPYRNIDRSLLIDESAISDIAYRLYEKEQDITKFNALAMSNPEDLSHNEIMDNLFGKGICDPYSDDALTDLLNNNKFLEDLSL